MGVGLGDIGIFRSDFHVVEMEEPALAVNVQRGNTRR
jgi:hypothetical protein